MSPGESAPVATWYASGWNRWKLRRSTSVRSTSARLNFSAAWSPPKPPPMTTTRCLFSCTSFMRFRRTVLRTGLAHVRAGNRRNMPAFFERVPPPQDDGDHYELPPELRDYIAACVRAARPSDLRSRALAALGVSAVDETVPVWIDWAGLEAEAERQGCTVADIVFDLAGRRQDPR